MAAACPAINQGKLWCDEKGRGGQGAPVHPGQVVQLMWQCIEARQVQKLLCKEEKGEEESCCNKAKAGQVVQWSMVHFRNALDGMMRLFFAT